MTHHKRTTQLELMAQYTAVSHNHTDLGYTLETSEATVFSSNNTCALVPETTIGVSTTSSLWERPSKDLDQDANTFD